MLTGRKVRLTRKHVESVDFGSVIVAVNRGEISAMYDTLRGDGRDYILSKMASRYARSIETLSNDDGEQVKFAAKTSEARMAAIKSGFFEVVSLYTYQRIVSELATLWVEGVKYTYSGDSGEIVFADDLNHARTIGGSDLAMATVDSYSVASGSSAALIQVVDGKFNYQPIGRDKIWTIFSDVISSDGIARPTINTNIEEASCVIIQLGSSGSESKRFAAWYGRSTKYPNGRFVQYTGKTYDEVPEVGEGALMEYQGPDGKIANPLTLWNSEVGGGPEYPIVLWYGFMMGYGDSLLPVNYDLYEQTREFDLAGSRLSMSALKSARGVQFLGKSDINAEDIIQEVIDEGPVIGGYGQTLTNVSNPASNSLNAWEVVQGAIASTASSYGVPPHFVAITNSVSFPSGYALSIANEPLERQRRARIKLNAPSALRKFEIERALASAETGEVLGTTLTEAWHPNDRQWPTSVEEDVRVSKERITAGLSSVEREIKELNNLDSIEAAKNWIAENLVKVDKEPVNV